MPIEHRSRIITHMEKAKSSGYKGKKMNWDRGLKRITLILSIIGAIILAGLFYLNFAQELKRTEEILNDTVRSGQPEGWSKDDYLESILFWENIVKDDRTQTMVGTIVGCLFGFCAVWISYAVMKLFIYAVVVKKLIQPVCMWVIYGFAEDKQKEEQKTNESGTVGD